MPAAISESPWLRAPRAAGALALFMLAASLAAPAHAVPAFARQTGQNCLACHAGGQYPDLTSYGRYFKLTGYTIGEHAVPVAAMAVASYNRTSHTGSTDPAFDSRAGFPKDGNLIFQTASAFLAGKVTEHLGAFAQFTYDNYDSQSPSDSHWTGHSATDNIDIRYADRLLSSTHDLIFGATVNNNPTVQDVWNTAPAWGYNVVPGSTGPELTPLLAGGLAQNAAGAGVYAFWDRCVYAELSSYRTADGFWSFMSQGISPAQGSQQVLKGENPYWRLALSHDWGPHSAMIGTFGLNAKVYPDPTDPTGPTNNYRDTGIDAQYQYVLDPHAVTVTGTYIHEHVDYADTVGGQPAPLDPDGSLGIPLTNTSDTLRLFQAKASYVYGAKYGGSASLFDVRGSTNSALQSAAYDPANPGSLLDGSESVSGNVTGSPDTRGYTLSLFWLPVQYARAGVEYTHFTRFNGLSSNYDGFGRDAKDNDTLFFYVWAAY